MYNILIRLGDPDFEQYKDFHLECNYSAKEIDKAYIEASKILDVDYIYTINHYLGGIPEIIVNKLNAVYSIIPKTYIENGEVSFVDSYMYITIYFNIIGIILPDIKYQERDLEEKMLQTINSGGL